MLHVCKLCAEEVDRLVKLCMPLLWCMPCRALEFCSNWATEFETAVAEQQPAGNNELFKLFPMHRMALNRACVVRDMTCVIQGGVLVVSLLLVVVRLDWGACCIM
jgi:hypothetical protein